MPNTFERRWPSHDIAAPSGFDLGRYPRHLQAHIGADERLFDDLPALEEDRRLDRTWRFVSIIFMAHPGLIDICQHERTILVNRHETD
ncbi:hypothetical protein [Anaerobaca lacustris]|uniref:Uncharacterized protein n=1 Tax=Anaerobaca lacustris TaxID=3044600 RepID=A0AAW6U0W3_9BACT|nr:hypothetical protein [Sedimentisphaerales bacterium M17dextr]